MISLDSSEVFVQGDEPSEILWRGKQWAVTVEGIEALDGTYYIGRERLLENEVDWPWVRQLGEKNWCDIDEFATAYLVAIVLHGYSQVRVPDFLRHANKAKNERQHA